jgi:hypothetical protein
MNAIDHASSMLCDALGERGHDARTVAWAPGRAPAEAAGADLLVLPYNPFMWGRWGFAPGLVTALARLRRRSPRPRLALLVHEPWVPVEGPRSLVMGAWQRLQLGALLLLADRRYASIEAWVTTLGRIRPVAHLPSGSNVPDRRSLRQAIREELELDGAFAVATLSTGHPSHLTGHVESALSGLDAAGIPTVFLQLGAGAPPVAAPSSVRVVTPGELTAERLAATLAAADLQLTPYVDGVSTRRGSFMAGLCQEVAVLGTRGPLTDQVLLGQGLELVDVHQRDRYAARAVALAQDDEARADAAHAGRRLFEAEFTWNAIADRLLR